MAHSTRKWLVGALCALALAASSLARSAESDVRQIWQMLDYLSVDYGGAVKDGVVLKASEFDEMREFAQASRTKMAALDANSEQAALLSQADLLVEQVTARAPPEKVAALARSLGDHLLAAYPVSSSPDTVPNLAAAATLYKGQCASCHGPSGKGDGAIGAHLQPPPIAFTGAERARHRSTFALYQVISQGIEGTSMASFSSIPEADRWALAFYVGQFAHTPQQRKKGEELWRDEPPLHAEVANLDALVRLTEADLGQRIGDERARAVIAYLHANPSAVVEPGSNSFGVARERLAQSVKAYEKGDVGHSMDLALSAYLDGVEPLEHALGTRDRALMGRIETGMSRYRSLIAGKAPVSELTAQIKTIEALFAEAEQTLAPSNADAATAFFGSFTILLREGTEALLVVVAMIAFLRKAERRDMLSYVHAGWIGALVTGVATWAAATYLIGISGASRELTEGFSNLFAAAVLMSVGMWMHQKSIAGRWQAYLREKMSAALNRKSALFLFGLAFIAVYREVFETILFYAALWGQGSDGAVVSGLVAGALVLSAIGVILLRYSKSLPIGRFFALSSMLVAVLAVVLTGKGIAALQEAGWVHAYATSTPRVDFLGIYPSLQTLGAQLLVAAIIGVGFLINTRWAKVRVQ